MKKTIVLAIVALFSFAAVSTTYANKCANCSSSSSCNQCRLGSKDTSEGRKRCEKMGCKITGTGSCSTASNVKVCG